MKVLLIYPPDRALPVPYSSLPTLAPCLKRAGHEVVLRDVNLDVFLSLMNKETLLRYAQIRMERLRELESKAFLNASETEEYKTLCFVLSVPKHFLENASFAIRTLRSKDEFYKPRLYNQAMDIIRGCMRFYYSENPLPSAEASHLIDRLFHHLSASRLDPITDLYRSHFVSEILRVKPDLIGISIPFMVTYFEAMKLVKCLREQAPEARIVVGGTLIDSFADPMATDPRLYTLFDYAMVGEADESLCQLASTLENGGDLASVPNLYYQAPDGGIKFNGKKAVEDLNALPGPDFTGMPLNRYPYPEPVVSFQTSRGCYYGACTFCSLSFRDNFRARDARRVVEDMANIQKTTGVQNFLLWDSLSPPRTLKLIAREIKERGCDFNWFAETKFEKVFTKPDFIKTLGEGGCRFLHFGLESANTRVLDLINKGNDMADVETILGNAREAGVFTSLSWFIGFPTETQTEAVQTYKFVENRRDAIALSIYCGTYTLLPDQLLFNDQERYGIKIRREEGGKYEYVYHDESQHYDRSEQHYAYVIRGDSDVLTHGSFLLYAAKNPDGLKGVTNYNRMGPLVYHLDNPESTLLQRASEVYYTRIGRDPIKDFNAPPSPVTLVYQSLSGEVFRLRGREMLVLEAAAEPASVKSLREKLTMEPSEFDAIIFHLANRGLIKVALKDFPEYDENRSELEILNLACR